MTAPRFDWLSSGRGEPPRLSWSLATEAAIVSVQFARETGEVLAADQTGALYLIDRKGEWRGEARGQSALKALAWSDTGGGGAALVGDHQLCWFNRELKFLGAVELPSRSVAIAVEQHGRYAAVSLDDNNTLLFDCHLRMIRHFQTPQPLISLQFLVTEAALIGVAAYGLLCAYDLNGELLWQEKLYANVGDLSVTGDGQMILLACFSHGVQCHDSLGRQRGSFQVGGTAARVSTSFLPGKLTVATTEQQLFRLDTDGQIEWEATLPEPVHSLFMEPLGHAQICALPSGRIFRLDWSNAL